MGERELALEPRNLSFAGLASKLQHVLVDHAHAGGPRRVAKGPWNPDFDATQLQVGLRWMLMNRVFDERMWQIQRQGRISFYMQATGEEEITG